MKTDDKKIVWVYESPDNGFTVYRRPLGKLTPRELVNKKIKINLNSFNYN